MSQQAKELNLYQHLEPVFTTFFFPTTLALTVISLFSFPFSLSFFITAGLYFVSIYI